MEEKRISMGGGKTEVSLSENTNEVDITGVNVVTKSPKVGDIVCYDENRKIKFIALDTFHAGTFPAAWETVGVVVLRKGNQVTICSKHIAWRKFMEVYPYIVTGYQLDGAEHTSQLRLHGKPTTSTYYEFKYTANTDSEFVTQLKQFLTDNGEANWSAYLMDGKVYLQYDNHTTAEEYSSYKTQATGLTLTAKVMIDFPEGHPDCWRKCGNQGNGVWNPATVKSNYKTDISAAVNNPSSDVHSEPSYPVCWPAFAGTSQYQEDHCLALRQKYCKDPVHPTIEEWEAYIDGLCHKIPYMLGGHAPKWRDGKALCDKVKDIEYQASDGTRKKLYPFISYCSSFFDGGGYLPSMTEFIEAFQDITYGLSGVTRDKADAINRSLYVIGGDAMYCNHGHWIPYRYKNYNYTMIMSSSGCIDGAYLYMELKSVPFARIELPLK